MGSYRSKEKLSHPMVVWEVKGQMLFTTPIGFKTIVP